MDEESIPNHFHPNQSAPRQQQGSSSGNKRSKEDVIAGGIVTRRPSSSRTPPSLPCDDTKNTISKQQSEDNGAIVVSIRPLKTNSSDRRSEVTTEEEGTTSAKNLSTSSSSSTSERDIAARGSSGVFDGLRVVLNNKKNADTTIQDDEKAGGITTDRLRADDVLLGRGTGPNEYVGNVRFRDAVRQVLVTKKYRRTPAPAAYLAARDTSKPSTVVALARSTPVVPVAGITAPPPSSSPSSFLVVARRGPDDSGSGGNRFPTQSLPASRAQPSSPTNASEKFILAQQIVDLIKSRGGRFLERVTPLAATSGGRVAAAADAADAPSTRSSACPLINYREVDDRVAVDKTRQSFRHQMKSLDKDFEFKEPRDSALVSSLPSQHKRKGSTIAAVGGMLGMVDWAIHDSSAKKMKRFYEQEAQTTSGSDRARLATNTTTSSPSDDSVLVTKNKSTLCLSALRRVDHHQKALLGEAEQLRNSTTMLLLQKSGWQQEQKQAPSTASTRVHQAPTGTVQLHAQQWEEATRQAALLNTEATLSQYYPCPPGPASLLYPTTSGDELTQQQLVFNASSSGLLCYPPSSRNNTSSVALWAALQQIEDDTRYLRQQAVIAQANSRRDAHHLTRELALLLALKDRK